MFFLLLGCFLRYFLGVYFYFHSLFSQIARFILFEFNLLQHNLGQSKYRCLSSPPEASSGNVSLSQQRLTFSGNEPGSPGEGTSPKPGSSKVLHLSLTERDAFAPRGVLSCKQQKSTLVTYAGEGFLGRSWQGTALLRRLEKQAWWISNKKHV